MTPDKDRPATWVRYRQGLCEGCWAACCTMPVEMRWDDIVRLEWADAEENPKEAARRLLKEKRIERYRDATGVFLMSRQSDGSCALLNAERRCCVYDKRPQTCRQFPQVNSRPGYCPAFPKNPSAKKN